MEANRSINPSFKNKVKEAIRQDTLEIKNNHD